MKKLRIETRAEALSQIAELKADAAELEARYLTHLTACEHCGPTRAGCTLGGSLRGRISAARGGMAAIARLIMRRWP